MKRSAKSRDPLIRTPDDWARDWGWVSRRRALNVAAKLEGLAEGLEADADPVSVERAKQLRQIAKDLAPTKVPAVRKRERRAREEQRSAA